MVNIEGWELHNFPTIEIFGEVYTYIGRDSVNNFFNYVNKDKTKHIQMVIEGKDKVIIYEV